MSIYLQSLKLADQIINKNISNAKKRITRQSRRKKQRMIFWFLGRYLVCVGCFLSAFSPAVFSPYRQAVSLQFFLYGP